MAGVYMVKKIETCDECEGSGRIASHEWREFFRKHPSGGFEKMGQYFGTLDSRRWPPEEYVCDECEGSGRITKDVPLASALIELGLIQSPA